MLTAFTSNVPRLWHTNRLLRLIGVACCAAAIVACGSDDPAVGGGGINASQPRATSVLAATEPAIAPTTNTRDTGQAAKGSGQGPTPDWQTPVGVGVSIDRVYFASTSELAWASSAIVTGSVVDVRSPQYIENPDPNRPSEVPQADPARIFTDYVVKVDRIYRGDVRDVIVIRQQGGTIQNVTVTNMSEPEMVVGQLGLFFLQPFDSPTASTQPPTERAYVAAAAWWVDGQRLIPALPPASDEQPPITSIDVMVRDIALALRGEPVGASAVPLSDASLGPDLP